MDYYDIWFNLKDTHKDSEFCDALDAYMAHLAAEGAIEGYRLRRRKLGFGPASLGEFNVTIETRGLAQLDEAFGMEAARSGKTEKLRRALYDKIKDMTTGLSRDFPDLLDADATPASDVVSSIVDGPDPDDEPEETRPKKSGPPKGLPRRRKRKRWPGGP